MLFTLEQFVLLAIVLFAGFLLGVASRPSARKWKRKVAAQSRSFTAYHADAEDRVRAAKERASALELEAGALRSDRAEAEHTIAALRAAQGSPTIDPQGHATPAPTSDDATSVERMHAPLAQSAARPAFGTTTVSGQDGEGGRDDLTRIRGIGTTLDKPLASLGVLRFEDIERLSAEDEMALEQRLALPVGYVGRERWRAQAALLRAGKDEDHAARFGDMQPATKS